jgi:hypothetical protein
MKLKDWLKSLEPLGEAEVAFTLHTGAPAIYGVDVSEEVEPSFLISTDYNEVAISLREPFTPERVERIRAALKLTVDAPAKCEPREVRP